MADIRTEIHEEVDRMTENELVGLMKILDTYPNKINVIARRAPVDDEPLTDEDRAALDESYEDLKNSGNLIPHEEIMREFGSKKARGDA